MPVVNSALDNRMQVGQQPLRPEHMMLQQPDPALHANAFQTTHRVNAFQGMPYSPESANPQSHYMLPEREDDDDLDDLDQDVEDLNQQFLRQNQGHNPQMEDREGMRLSPGRAQGVQRQFRPEQAQ